MDREAKDLMQRLFSSYLQAAGEIVELLEAKGMGEAGQLPPAVKERLERAIWHDDNHRRQVEFTRHQRYPHTFDANAPGGWLNHLLASWAAERGKLAAELVNLKDEDLQVKAGEGEWTIAEIVEHTIATDAVHARRVREALLAS